MRGILHAVRRVQNLGRKKERWYRTSRCAAAFGLRRSVSKELQNCDPANLVKMQLPTLYARQPHNRPRAHRAVKIDNALGKSARS